MNPDRTISSLRDALSKTVGAVGPCTIALSGGLDSSILAILRSQRSDTRCVSVVSTDFGAPDMTYSQLVARKAGLPLDIINVDVSQILETVEKVTKVLGNYNVIEVRSAAVMHMALENAKTAGSNLVMTGDGADELFGGYSFLVNSPQDQLREKLERLQRIMRFSTLTLAKSIGINVALPFADTGMAELSRQIPDDMLVHSTDDGRIGKWILRKAFEKDVTSKIAWRKKVPMSEGSGFDGIQDFLERMIPDSVFESRALAILESDGIKIRNKESLHYYDAYRKAYKAPKPASEGAPRCPDCKSDVSANDGRFCRMCGKFPI